MPNFPSPISSVGAAASLSALLRLQKGRRRFFAEWQRLDDLHHSFDDAFENPQQHCRSMDRNKIKSRNVRRFTHLASMLLVSSIARQSSHGIEVEVNDGLRYPRLKCGTQEWREESRMSTQ
jgi:hypothetical protein